MAMPAAPWGTKLSWSSTARIALVHISSEPAAFEPPV
jgi:hypothetical protein